MFHTVSNGTLCFIGRLAAPFKTPGAELPHSSFLFKYDLCSAGKDPRATHEAVAAVHFGAPQSPVDSRALTHPIWSTWARYKEDVDEAIVMQFADEIIGYGFRNSQVMYQVLLLRW